MAKYRKAIEIVPEYRGIGKEVYPAARWLDGRYRRNVDGNTWSVEAEVKNATEAENLLPTLPARREMELAVTDQELEAKWSKLLEEKDTFFLLINSRFKTAKRTKRTELTQGGLQIRAYTRISEEAAGHNLLPSHPTQLP